jgi:hypothetical protein
MREQENKKPLKSGFLFDHDLSPPEPIAAE